MIWIKVAKETQAQQGFGNGGEGARRLDRAAPAGQERRMADADRDEMLRDMAANRGCRLVKSRKRTPGSGDYGRYGLRDSKTGQDVYGFGAGGLAATAEDIENYLRGGLRS